MSHADPLLTPLQFVKGVGPKRAELLARLSLLTASDVLWYQPRDYLDLTNVRSADQLEKEVLQTVRGRVVDRDARSLRNGGSLTAVLLDCGTGYVRGLWFNQPWMFRKFDQVGEVLFSGKPKWSQGRWEFNNPVVQFLAADEEADPQAAGVVLPQYGLTEGLRMHEMRRVVRQVVQDYADLVADPLPAEFRTAHHLPSVAQALRQIHLPDSVKAAGEGRRCLVFNDLLDLQIALALRRRYWKTRRAAPVMTVGPKVDARIRRLFPFAFTAGQDTAVEEIARDLGSGQAMQRLLQADVGAGKTAVAVYAMLAAVAAGYQACLMAPTELLTQQHWQTIERLLAHSRVERLLLTGRLTASERATARSRLADGSVQLIVGTQALIQEGVQFHKLGLVVVDEQHRFGVEQRAHFASSGENIHLLVMTATPIPRSLCLTQFGDLDLTVIRELPPGRQQIVTSRLADDKSRGKAWEFVRKKLSQGRQAYLVCPRVSESAEGTGPATSAESLYREIQQTELQGFRVGMVHGQMERDLRDATMEGFRRGDLDALVSTTVIEVGVDVPNANLMLIYEPEQFGLSQLHQLRGRIGRGEFQGYCFLLPRLDRPDSQARLEAFEKCHNGFEVAEADFLLRGPGDIVGTRQHGDMPLRVADLTRDTKLLEQTRATGQDLVQRGEIDSPDYAMLKIRVLDRFAKPMDLGQAG